VDFFSIALGDLHHLIPSPRCELLSILAAFLCGTIVGIEREKGHKPAGLRTQILICMGSAIFTMMSASQALGGHEPARIAAQIVTGVGFLGAGSILRDRHQITGLTTAATIWTVSAIGITVGAGYIVVGILLSVGVLLVLGSFRRVEGILSGPCHMTRIVAVYRPDKGKTRALIRGLLDDAHGPVLVGEENQRPDGLADMSIQYCECHRDHRALLAQLASLPNVDALEKSNEGPG
jgi:putative Mg2+ transporter-C (MgtC) family protein